MSFDPVEGVDYIFDRYTYLGLTPEAARSDIESAVREKRAGVHPDRLIKVDENVRREADIIRKHTDACAEILLNEELRPLYDTRLAWFKENKPRLVSENGAGIIDMSSEHLAVDFLLNGEKHNFEDLIKKAESMSGYVPKQLALFKRLYEAEPESEDIRDGYRHALEKKWIYLSLMEDFAWAQAGVANAQTDKHLFMEDGQYQVRLEQRIEARHEDIRAAITERNGALQIGIAQPPLLLADLRNAGQTMTTTRGMTEEEQARLAEKVTEVFEDRAGWLRELAKEKEELLTELISLTRIVDLDAAIDTTKPYLIHLMGVLGDGEPKSVMTFVAANNGNVTTTDEEAFTNKTADELKAMGHQGCLVYNNPEIRQMVLEIRHAANRYFERYVDPKPEEADRTNLTGDKADIGPTP